MSIEFNLPAPADAAVRMPTDRILGPAVLVLALAVPVLAWRRKP